MPNLELEQRETPSSELDDSITTADMLLFIEEQAEQIDQPCTDLAEVKTALTAAQVAIGTLTVKADLFKDIDPDDLNENIATLPILKRMLEELLAKNKRN